jgi:hypothetical protein
VLVANRTPAPHRLPQLSGVVRSVNNQKLSARTVSSFVAAANIIPKGRETWVLGVSEAETSFIDKL